MRGMIAFLWLLTIAPVPASAQTNDKLCDIYRNAKPGPARDANMAKVCPKPAKKVVEERRTEGLIKVENTPRAALRPSRPAKPRVPSRGNDEYDLSLISPDVIKKYAENVSIRPLAVNQSGSLYGDPCNGPFIIFFERGSYKITADFEPKLHNIASSYLTCNKSKIVIAGHTDRIGPINWRDRLARARAEVTFKYLRYLLKGFSATFELNSFGSNIVYVATADNVPEFQNRRVEITFE